MKARFFARHSTLSARSSFLAMFFASKLIVYIHAHIIFLQQENDVEVAQTNALLSKAKFSYSSLN